jgi:hypothetical protein
MTVGLLEESDDPIAIPQATTSLYTIPFSVLSVNAGQDRFNFETTCSSGVLTGASLLTRSMCERRRRERRAVGLSVPDVYQTAPSTPTTIQGVQY